MWRVALVSRSNDVNSFATENSQPTQERKCRESRYWILTGAQKVVPLWAITCEPQQTVFVNFSES